MKKTFVAGLLVVLAAAGAALAQEASAKAPRVGVVDMARVSAESLLGKTLRRPAGEAPERHHRRGHQEADRARQARHRDQDPAGRAREAGSGPEPGGAGQEAAGDRSPRPASARRFLEDGQAEINRMRERAQQQAQSINNEFQLKVRPLVEQVAKDKGYDLVLDSQVAYTINKDFDITRDVIAEGRRGREGQARGGRGTGTRAGDPQAVGFSPPGAWRRGRGAVVSPPRPHPARVPSRMSSGEIGRLVRQIPTQYPFVLVDRILEHDPAGRLVAVKNVTGAEDFFAGHFPSQPGDAGRPDPGVAGAGRRHLAAQDGSRPAAVSRSGWSASTTRSSAGPWCPATSCGSRSGSCTAAATSSASTARCGWARRARPRRACCSRWRRCRRADVDPLARVAPGAVLEPGVQVGPFCVVGAGVRLGPGHGARLPRGDRRRHPGRASATTSSRSARSGSCRRTSSSAASRRRVEIGDRNVFREGTTVHRGTAGGGGAHPHRLGQPVHGAGARGPRLPRREPHDLRERRRRLSGHVEVQDFATLGGFSGVHQFCRVGNARVHGRRHGRHQRRGCPSR